jgi:hypothetical protein
MGLAVVHFFVLSQLGNSMLRLTLILILLSPLPAVASLPYVLDAQSWDNPQTVTIESMAFTPTGNIAVTGHFEGTLIFAGADTLTSVDKEDVYLAVLSPNGTPQWALSFGGTSHQLARDIDVDAAGNFVLCGTVFAQADLGGGELIAPAGFAPFVVVYDAAGNYVWGELPDFDFASAVTFASNGDILLLGDMDGFIGPPDPVGGPDIYLGRYSPSGTLLFELRLGSTGSDYGGDVVALPDGGCVVSGSVKQNWPTSSFNDAYLARYDAAGSQLWNSDWGGSYDEDVSALAVGPDGSLYFGGDFRSTDAPFLSQPWRDMRDWYVAKADSNGVVQWVRNGGWLGDDRVVALDVADNGDVAVTGSIRGRFQDGDLMVAYFNAAGDESLRVAFPYPDDAPDQGRALLLDDERDMLVGGIFRGTLSLGWHQLQTLGLQSAFLARMQVSSPLTATQPPNPAAVLRQNVPNPFNPHTTIRFVPAEASEVAIEIFDARGRKVRALRGGLMPEGEHELVWDGRDEAGRLVASGVYRYRLAGESASAGLKMVLLR